METRLERCREVEHRKCGRRRAHADQKIARAAAEPAGEQRAHEAAHERPGRPPALRDGLVGGIGRAGDGIRPRDHPLARRPCPDHRNARDEDRGERGAAELPPGWGGGDSFASGLAFGFLEFNCPEKAVDYGAAHGALASTTPGDTSMATRAEVEKQIKGGGARVVR